VKDQTVSHALTQFGVQALACLKTA